MTGGDAVSTSREQPPDTWPDLAATRVTDDIYFAWLTEPNPLFWHWCTAFGRWIAAGTPLHTLIARDPLHLEPSLLWECCGLHGWIRDGQWTNA